MKILDAKFVQDFIKMANDGFLQGWHERNGGNLSYRLKPEEVDRDRNRGSGTCRRILPCNRKWKVFQKYYR